MEHIVKKMKYAIKFQKSFPLNHPRDGQKKRWAGPGVFEIPTWAG